MSVLTGNLGPRVTQTRHVEGFSRVALDGIGHVRIIHSDAESVEISAPERLIEHIEILVEDGTLRIGFERDAHLHNVGKLDIEYHVHVRSVEALSINGAGSIVSKRLDGASPRLSIDGAGKISVDDVDAETLNLSVDGAGKIDSDHIRVRSCKASIDGAGKVRIREVLGGDLLFQLDGAGKVQLEQVEAQKLEVLIDGACSMAAAGRAEDVHIDINGMGKVRFEDLRSRTAHVDIDGTGKVELRPTDSLDVRIDGFGKVAYHGKPTVNVTRGGFGRVVSLDD